MECVGAMCEGEWNNSSLEEADFMAQLLGGNCSFPNEVQMNNIAALSMYSSSFSMGGQNHVGYYYHPTNFIMDDDGKNMNGFRVANDALVDEAHEEDMESDDLQRGIEKIPEISKKRHRLPLDVPRNGKLNKSCVKIDDDGVVCSDQEDDSNGVSWSSSSRGSGALRLNLSGKTRANRGSATDPQSIYARKRRERINERLRILQNLVPNGTKVDLSTMLEEAVQYVKFLQLQIKLLSSDELWMYAPIAYNGMDIGHHINIPTPKSQSS